MIGIELNLELHTPVGPIRVFRDPVAEHPAYEVRINNVWLCDFPELETARQLAFRLADVVNGRNLGYHERCGP